MFLILPKNHSPSTTKPESTRSLPDHSDVPVRAKKACDRCRVKKIKCDGRKPCGRCAHDKVQCLQTRRATTDPKALSRDYIASLEAQQAYLLDALRQLCHRGSGSDDPEVRAILERLQVNGVDLDYNNIPHPGGKGLVWNEEDCTNRGRQDISPSSPAQPESVVLGAQLSNDVPVEGFMQDISFSRPVTSDTNTAAYDMPNGLSYDQPSTLTFPNSIDATSGPALSSLSNGITTGSSFGLSNPNFADQWLKSWNDIAQELSSANEFNGREDSDYSDNLNMDSTNIQNTNNPS